MIDLTPYTDSNGDIDLKKELIQKFAGIVESGSNENGRYVKFEDGTQICTRRATVSNITINQAYGNAFIGYVGWDFPASFSESPSIQCSAKKDGIVTLTAFDNSTLTSCSFYLIDILTGRGASGNTTINCVAIGRWK